MPRRARELGRVEDENGSQHKLSEPPKRVGCVLDKPSAVAGRPDRRSNLSAGLRREKTDDERPLLAIVLTLLRENQQCAPCSGQLWDVSHLPPRKSQAGGGVSELREKVEEDRAFKRQWQEQQMPMLSEMRGTVTVMRYLIPVLLMP